MSVVVPTCNRRAVLARCLDALLAQSYPRYEIIVVDDCSTDDTPAFLQSFAADHPQLPFRWFRNPSHAGANPSRNRGIREAAGAFVAFLDNDCIAEPDWLARLMGGFTGEQVAAVTGLVADPKPANIYELTFKGTHRVHGRGRAGRLVAGNMCVRRPLLLQFMLDEDRAPRASTGQEPPDVTVSGRCDEEGLYLLLCAAGHEVRVVPEAVVVHEHHFGGRRFFRQAYRGGKSAGQLVYKYHLPPRLDMLPFVLTYLTLPLVIFNRWLVTVPALFFAGALAAIIYNDLFRKGKTLGEMLRSFPVLLAYYHVRLVGYVIETIRLRLGRHRPQRVRLDRLPPRAPNSPAS